jgi:hypothetical protein
MEERSMPESKQQESQPKRQAARRDEGDVETLELAGGTKVSRGRGVEPGPDVSNADIDVAALSLDSNDSEIVENPDPNPFDLRPEPGPSSIEVLGTPKEAGG